MDARKERYAGKDLKRLFAGARSILAAKGRKSVRFDMKRDPPGVAELAKAVLGPSGNLRAPTLKLGDDWVVGFGEDAWTEYFD